MVWAEFYEREYELAMAAELTAGAIGSISAPAQVVEAVVGYDAAADVDPTHVVWEVLTAPRPAGVRLVPQMWHPGQIPKAKQLPTLPVSLIFQYKRPEYLEGARAKQWRTWHRPYYRFTRSTSQHAVLVRLSKRLGHDVLVRYASPAFHKRAELEAFHTTRQVLRNSGFVDPLVFGKHRVWTYDRPGSVGFTNDDARPSEFGTIEQIREMLIQPDGASPNLPAERRIGWRDHLVRVGQAAQERQPALRRDLADWRASLRRVRPRLAEETIDVLVAVGSITSLLALQQAVWYLGARGES